MSLTKGHQILFNAFMSMAQVALVGISLFFLYRLLLRSIGAEKVGIWSVVLATSSFANLANLGISASVVRFVAKYRAQGEENKIQELIQTSVISLGIFMGLALIVAYPLARFIIDLVIPYAHLSLAIRILPFALFSLWVTIVSNVFQAGLDGIQRIDIRSAILSGGAIFFLILCLLLVPEYGLLGVAYSQVINSVALMVTSLIILKRQLPLLPFLPKRWNRSLFREIIGYSFKFQIISAFSMLFDPITKSLVAKFGGLSLAGFYDMASRMIIQLRSLIVSANQVLVPAIADLQVHDSGRIGIIYRESFRLMTTFSIPMFGIVAALSPIISELWIGRVEPSFVIFSVLLALGWCVNSLTVPAYFVYLGTGYLSWNVVSHGAIGVMNVLLGLWLGASYGGVGVAIGWIISLICGSLLVILSYHFKNHLPYAGLFAREDKNIIWSSALGLGVSLLISMILGNVITTPIRLCIVLAVYFPFIAIPFWKHSFRIRFARWAKQFLFNQGDRTGRPASS